MKKRKFNEGWFYANAAECRDIFDNPPEFQAVTLPHDAMIKGTRNVSSVNENTTGFYDGVSCIYTKEINLSDYAGVRRFILKFEGVYMNAMVYVNDELAGKCPYGYTQFLVDITDYLQEDFPNVIKVLAKNDMNLTSRWYTGAGIYRDVYLLTGTEAYVVPETLKINAAPGVNHGASVKIAMEVYSEIVGASKMQIRMNIKDKQDNVVAFAEYPVTIKSGAKTSIYQRIYICDAKLWSLEQPYLYTLQCEVIVNDKIVDVVSENFGIRTITADAVNGLLINGEVVKLRGACIHHDNGILGAATHAKAEERRIRLLKEAGFNAIRSAHNPISEALLKACDRYGLLVMDEAYDMWNTYKSEHDYASYFKEWWKYDLKAMVDKDYNHPCVFMYSLGNEIQEIGTASGAATARMLADYVRGLDTERFVGGAVNGMFTIFGCMEEILKDILSEQTDIKIGGDVNQMMTMLDANMGAAARHPKVGKAIEEACAAFDICGYNYMDARYEMDGKQYPNRIIVGSESNPDAIYNNWKLVKKLNHVIGDFVWTGWDYIGESGIGKIDYTNTKGKGIYGPYPWYLAYCGDIDICGNRRPQSYYREIVWGLRTKPFIAVENPKYYGQTAAVTNWSWSDTIDSWTWPGYEGRPIHVEIYSDCMEAELFINGKSIERKTVPEAEWNNKIKFDVIYEPGIIEVRTYQDGILQQSASLKTAGTNIKMNLQVDEQCLKTGDLTFINISLEDENGILSTCSREQVAVTVSGGTLLGYGSADPTSLENFYDNVRTPWNGRLLAVVRVDGSESCLEITAHTKGLEDVKISIPIINEREVNDNDI